jgi:hypothetical protein
MPALQLKRRSPLRRQPVELAGASVPGIFLRLGAAVGTSLALLAALRIRALRRHCEAPPGLVPGEPDDRLRNEAIRIVTAERF